MLQFLISWPVLMAVAMAFLALAFLIEPASQLAQTVALPKLPS